ncbi:MAG: hypothetical protein ACRDNO_11215, partial [Trebonia sp.]
MRLDGLLTYLDQVAVAPLLRGDAGRAEPGRGGPAPDRQAARNRQHRHVGGVVVGAHQPAAEPPGAE